MNSLLLTLCLAAPNVDPPDFMTVDMDTFLHRDERPTPAEPQPAPPKKTVHLRPAPTPVLSPIYIHVRRPGARFEPHLRVRLNFDPELLRTLDDL